MLILGERSRTGRVRGTQSGSVHKKLIRARKPDPFGSSFTYPGLL